MFCCVGCVEGNARLSSVPSLRMRAVTPISYRTGTGCPLGSVRQRWSLGAAMENKGIVKVLLEGVDVGSGYGEAEPRGRCEGILCGGPLNQRNVRVKGARHFVLLYRTHTIFVFVLDNREIVL